MFGFIERAVARSRRRRDQKYTGIYLNQYQWELYLSNQRYRYAREHSRYAIGGREE
jgi:hypothetical protein